MSLKNLFTDIADAIREKKGTTDKIVAKNFPDEILSIKGGEVGGGGLGDGKYLIQVLDYDGSILQQARLNQGDKFILPPEPIYANNNRLRFQEWCNPPQLNIYENANGDKEFIVPNSDVFIGAIYTTASGYDESTGKSDITEMDFAYLNSDFVPRFVIKARNDVTIYGLNPNPVYVSKGDTYTSSTNGFSGDYTIKIKGDFELINFYIDEDKQEFKNIFAFYSGDNLKAIRTVQGSDTANAVSGGFRDCRILSTFTFSKSDVWLGIQAFYKCLNLRYIAIPNSFHPMITSISDFYNNKAGVFCYCYSLQTVSGMFSYVNTQEFIACKSLKNINQLVSATVASFKECSSLSKVSFAKEIKAIGGSAFWNCSNVLEYDFTDCKTVPTLNSPNVFYGINLNCKIVVPDDLYDNWLASTNWLTYKKYIIKKSDYVGG